MTSKIYVYKFKDNKQAGIIKQLKPEVNFDEYKMKCASKGINVIKTKKLSLATMEKCVDNGSMCAVDGCTGIECDGICTHGFPTYLSVMGMI